MYKFQSITSQKYVFLQIQIIFPENIRKCIEMRIVQLKHLLSKAFYIILFCDDAFFL